MDRTGWRNSLTKKVTEHARFRSQTVVSPNVCHMQALSGAVLIGMCREYLPLSVLQARCRISSPSVYESCEFSNVPCPWVEKVTIVDTAVKV